MQILLFNDNCWICYFYFYFTSEVERLFPSTAEGDEELNDDFFQISSRHGETVFYRSFFLIKPSGCLEAPASCLFYFFSPLNRGTSLAVLRSRQLLFAAPASTKWGRLAKLGRLQEKRAAPTPPNLFFFVRFACKNWPDFLLITRTRLFFFAFLRD